jgi:DNA-binding MarR family transcriptional regulator
VLTEDGHRLVRASMEARQRWFAALADRLSPHERDLAAAALRTLAVHGSAADDAAHPRRNAKEHPDR